MKFSRIVLGSLFFGFSTAAANTTCLSEAKLQARLYSAKNNKVSVRSVRVEDSFFHSETRGVLYYGILLNNQDQVNVGLRKADCSLFTINYVTDGV